MRCFVFALVAVVGCGSSTPPPAAPQLAPTPEIQSSPSEGSSEPPVAAQPAIPSPVAVARARLVDGMARYDRMLRAMDAAGLARLFTADGEVAVNGQVVAASPAGIEQFLGSFAGKVRVDRTASTVENVEVEGDRGTTSGHFAQDATILAGNTVVHASGAFTTEWQCDSNGVWRIRKIDTTPDAPPHP